MLNKLSKLDNNDNEKILLEIENQILEIEEKRDLTKIWFHIDMDGKIKNKN